MRIVVGVQWSVVSLCGRLTCLLLSAFCLLSCSIPNLEQPECDQARDVAREFYSFHFGNEMAFSVESLEKRKFYLTPRLYEGLKASPPAADPFTRTDDLPKAFRIGECKVIEPGRRVGFNVLLFWKTDIRTEQRAIDVEAENIDGKWLIDSIDTAAE